MTAAAREVEQLGRATDGAKLPDDLRAAWDWTSAAGELRDLRDLTGRALTRYCQDSALNNHDDGDGSVTTADLLSLHEWLVEHAPRIGRPPRSGVTSTGGIKVRVTPEEEAAFAATAGTAPVSAWLRDLGRKASGLDKRRR